MVWNGKSNYSADRHSYVSTAEVHRLVERDSGPMTGGVRARKESPFLRPGLKNKEKRYRMERERLLRLY